MGRRQGGGRSADGRVERRRPSGRGGGGAVVGGGVSVHLSCIQTKSMASWQSIQLNQTEQKEEDDTDHRYHCICVCVDCMFQCRAALRGPQKGGFFVP